MIMGAPPARFWNKLVPVGEGQSCHFTLCASELTLPQGKGNAGELCGEGPVCVPVLLLGSEQRPQRSPAQSVTLE